MNKVLTCHKCGQLVDPSNSLARFELKFGVWPNSDPKIDCHLYPMNEIPCEGSPKEVEMIPDLVEHNNRINTSVPDCKW